MPNNVQLSNNHYSKPDMNKLEAIQRAFSSLIKGEPSNARKIIRHGYPFEPIEREARRYTLVQSMKTFLRDGFIDRYSGEKLLYPGALRILNLELPNEFPYQAHWKASETHMAYWHYHPTVDHVVPIARGGSDSESNLVTTSQLRNSAKAHWLLEELGWDLHPPGLLDSWDGLLGETKAYVQKNPTILEDGLLRRWHRALTEAEKTR